MALAYDTGYTQRVAGHDEPYPYVNHLLDRLNNESAVSGALYVALVGLWTAVVESKHDLPQEMLYTVAEAIAQYERMHMP